VTDRLMQWLNAPLTLAFASASGIIDPAAAHESLARRARAGELLVPEVGNRVPKRRDRERHASAHALVIVRELPDELERHQRGAARVERGPDLICALHIDGPGGLESFRIARRMSQSNHGLGLLPTPAPDRSAVTGRKTTERSQGWDDNGPV
jgi:hypothetical protein